MVNRINLRDELSNGKIQNVLITGSTSEKAIRIFEYIYELTMEYDHILAFARTNKDLIKLDKITSNYTSYLYGGGGIIDQHHMSMLARENSTKSSLYIMINPINSVIKLLRTLIPLRNAHNITILVVSPLKKLRRLPLDMFHISIVGNSREKEMKKLIISKYLDFSQNVAGPSSIASKKRKIQTVNKYSKGSSLLVFIKNYDEVKDLHVYTTYYYTLDGTTNGKSVSKLKRARRAHLVKIHKQNMLDGVISEDVVNEINKLTMELDVNNVKHIQVSNPSKPVYSNTTIGSIVENATKKEPEVDDDGEVIKPTAPPIPTIVTVVPPPMGISDPSPLYDTLQIIPGDVIAPVTPEKVQGNMVDNSLILDNIREDLKSIQLSIQESRNAVNGSVNTPSVNNGSVNTPSVSNGSVNTPSVSNGSVNTPSVNKPIVKMNDIKSKQSVNKLLKRRKGQKLKNRLGNEH